MTDQDKAKAIERANSYRQMMESWAWKDFSEVARERRSAALEKALNAVSMDEVQQARGAVRFHDSLMSELDFILEAV